MCLFTGRLRAHENFKEKQKHCPVFLPNAFLRAKTSLNFHQPKRFENKHPELYLHPSRNSRKMSLRPGEKWKDTESFSWGFFFLFREKVLATRVDIIYSCCSPSSLRPLFFQRLFLGYLCWIGTISLDVVDSSLDFFLVPSTCWSSIYFKVPKERVQEGLGGQNPTRDTSPSEDLTKGKPHRSCN